MTVLYPNINTPEEQTLQNSNLVEERSILTPWWKKTCNWKAAVVVLRGGERKEIEMCGQATLSSRHQGETRIVLIQSAVCWQVAPITVQVCCFRSFETTVHSHSRPPEIVVAWLLTQTSFFKAPWSKSEPVLAFTFGRTPMWFFSWDI